MSCQSFLPLLPSQPRSLPLSLPPSFPPLPFVVELHFRPWNGLSQIPGLDGDRGRGDGVVGLGGGGREGGREGGRDGRVRSGLAVSIWLGRR